MILRGFKDLAGFIPDGHNLNNKRYAHDTVLTADLERRRKKYFVSLSKKARRKD